jgi:hypothetical protein
MKELLEELGFKDENGVYLPMLSELINHMREVGFEWFDIGEISVDYTYFITQPLTKGMFVPCDEGGNVLELFGDWGKIGKSPKEVEQNNKQYQQAKEHVLFEVWTQRDSEHLNFMNFEFDLTDWGLYLEDGVEAYKHRGIETIEQAINNGVKLYLK